MEEYEQNILKHIELHGCSVTSVFDPEEKSPPFSYSIGIAKTYCAPEVIVVGLKRELAHWMVNEYKRRVAGGESFTADVPYTGFLEGHVVRFGPVAEENRKEYMRSTCWLHGGSGFEALQLIWPNTSGIWPWEASASEWLRTNQPLLSNGPIDVAP